MDAQEELAFLRSVAASQLQTIKALTLGCEKYGLTETTPVVRHLAAQDDEIERLRAELAARMGRSVKTVYSVAYKLGLRKSGTYFAAGLGGRAGDGRGTATRFQPGHTTWNKGQRYIAGIQARP